MIDLYRVGVELKEHTKSIGDVCCNSSTLIIDLSKQKKFKNEIHLLLDTENPDIILTEAQDDLLNSRLINIRYGRIELYLNRRDDTILNLYNNINLTLNWQYFYNYDQYDLGVILGDIWRFEINDLIRKLKDIVNMQKRNEPIIGVYKYIIHFFRLDARLIALLLRHARRLSCAVRATPLKK